MISLSDANKTPTKDYRQFKQDMSSLIYKAIPQDMHVLCKGPTSANNCVLSSDVHKAIGQITSDVLTKGKASWCLCISPDKDSDRPFSFMPRKSKLRGHKTIPMVIPSSRIGISRKAIRSLTNRLKRSGLSHSDITLLRFDQTREIIADKWGHALSWYRSDPPIFTDAFRLINECDSIILAIALCSVIQDAMNETLSKSGLTDYKINIPTLNREQFESSRRLYIEGNLDDEAFSNLVYSRDSSGQCITPA